MANAHPELKAVADEVTLSNEEDGIAVVLERLFGCSESRSSRVNSTS
jgi:hydroxymethylpyrimidine pyrophosphatase-like HAD family hydrolase